MCRWTARWKTKNRGTLTIGSIRTLDSVRNAPRGFTRMVGAFVLSCGLLGCSGGSEDGGRVSGASVSGIGITSGSPTAIPVVNLDVDGNGKADGLTDGLLIIRFLFGFTGAALTDGAIDPTGIRTQPNDIVAYLNQARPTMLDVDGNGQADALTDGLLIERFLFGFTDETLVNGAVDPAGTRIDATSITSFLTSYLPTGGPATACTGSSPIWTSTPDQASVASCISMAVSGDTINVSAGSAAWSTKVTLDKSISLIGAGEGSTVITDDVSDDNMLAIGAGSTPITPRVSGMTIKGFNTSKVNLDATVAVAGISEGLGFRLDHITFDNILITGIGTQDSVWGVVDHCTFNMVVTATGWAIYLTNDRWGDLTLCCGDMAWASPDDFGTKKFVFVEDSTFNPIGTGPTNYIDSVGGARYVIRHNTFKDGFLRAHGTDSTPKQRGTRIVEVYDNVFANNVDTSAEMLELRSGTAVFYNNISSGSGGFNNAITLKEFRDNGNFWPPWGPCNGTTAWDQNTLGEAGYACLDQPGRGQGNLATSTDMGLSPAAWPNQALSPVYIWDNTGLRNNQGVSTSTRIQPNRDFFNSPMPNYTPYPYPHPLQ